METVTTRQCSVKVGFLVSIVIGLLSVTSVLTAHARTQKILSREGLAFNIVISKAKNDKVQKPFTSTSTVTRSYWFYMLFAKYW